MHTSQNLATTRQTSDDHDVNRDVLIRLLVTQAEKEAMQESAKREGLTISEWVRQRCFVATTTIHTLPAPFDQAEPAVVDHVRAGLRAGRFPTDVEVKEQMRKNDEKRVARRPSKKGGK